MKKHDLQRICVDEDLQCLLNRVADKWTTLIIGSLEGDAKRFGALQREIGGISQKVLTQTLRELERNGIVRRRIYAEVPPRVEYSLTPLGHTLSRPLAALRQWTVEYRADVAAARRHFDVVSRSDKSKTQEISIRHG